jgi:hypothetical protein
MFDPIGILATLERHRVSFVVVGTFARVIHGTGEVTRAIDIVPSMKPENLGRLDAALEDLNARRSDGKKLTIEQGPRDEPVIELETDRGALAIVPQPAGTRGYDDLRRAAAREPLGSGVRPSVASVGDLTRMLGALDREQDQVPLQTLRRLAELERQRVIEL